MQAGSEQVFWQTTPVFTHGLPKKPVPGLPESRVAALPDLIVREVASALEVIALVNNQDTAKKILVAMYLPASVPELQPARPPPADRKARHAQDWLNWARRPRERRAEVDYPA